MKKLDKIELFVIGVILGTGAMAIIAILLK